MKFKELKFIEYGDIMRADIGNFHATITKAKPNVYNNDDSYCYCVIINIFPTGKHYYRNSLKECKNLIMSEYQGYIKKIIVDLELSQANKRKMVLIIEFDNYITSLVEVLNQYVVEPVDKRYYTIL
jgi:antibiotic biosynthesis monooxygenase (ABM) superfamily enzyme